MTKQITFNFIKSISVITVTRQSLLQIAINFIKFSLQAQATTVALTTLVLLSGNHSADRSDNNPNLLRYLASQLPSTQTDYINPCLNHASTITQARRR
ncbi:hypothetical protein NXS19_003990 [Fusarium pseudograminearum]|nr:hypothetical protein NXS19_003990 [Fusarium pseudograminearum]